MEKVVSDRPGEPTTRLGSYEIVRRLARGGMAELFLARVADSERVIALKKILPKYADNPRFVQLFCDEARLAASLAHPNIVKVFDVGVDSGNYFFAMEYLHGQDVRSILHRAWRDGERMPIQIAVQIAIHIAAALHFAHEKRRPDGSLLGVIHRDVSPSNIIVSYDGEVKLVDFGVAKAATSTVKTRTGTLKGKISYMSPEQARGAPIDRRSDVFSLGIVLWEMCTTQRLFRGDNDLATLQLIINQPPKHPSEMNPDVPPALERIVLKALSQDIAQRYQSADELLRDLEGFARSQDLAITPAELGKYMSALFAIEMAHWHEAQAHGVPLAEHLTQIGDVTTPVSESEFIEPLDLEGDEDEEEDEHTEEPSTLIPIQQAPVTGMVRERHNTPPPLPRRDQTPSPHPMAHTPSGGTRRPAAATPSGVATAVRPVESPAEMVTTVMDQAAPGPGPMAATPNPWPASSTPGSGVRAQDAPLQIKSSRDSMSGRLATMTMKLYADIPPLDPVRADRTQKIAIYAGGVILLAILVVAIAMGGAGDGGKPAAALPPEDNAVVPVAPDAGVAPAMTTDAAVEPAIVPVDVAEEDPPEGPAVKAPDKKVDKKLDKKVDKRPDKKLDKKTDKQGSGSGSKPDINDVMPPPRRP